jgi:glutathione S-transferase
MITLFGGGPGFGLPELSPFVTKTEVQLVMLGIPYTKELARPDRSPKGQLPFIDDDGSRIADSYFIRAHLEAKVGKDLDAPLDARQRAEAWIVERMLEDSLAQALRYMRWMLPENFAKGPAHFVDGAPEAQLPRLREELLGRMRDILRAAGAGRHSLDEVTGMGERSLSALSLLLGDKPHLFGEKATAVDATAFAMLAGILTPFFPSPLRQKALTHANLVAYTGRMMTAFFPEHRWEVAG